LVTVGLKIVTFGKNKRTGAIVVTKSGNGNT